MELSTFTVNELCLAIICVFNLGIGAFVLFNQPKRLVNRAFSLVALSIFIWGSGLILISHTHNFAWNTLILAGFVLIVYSLVIFSKVFPDAKHISWKFCCYAALPPLAVIILAPLKLIIKAGVFREGSNPEPINGPLYPFFLAVSALYIGTSIFLFIQTFRHSKGKERNQMRYFIFGLSTFAVCAFLFDILLPSIGIYQLNFLGAISSIILTGATAYAIIRHELLDIRIVIQRSLIYTILLVAITATYSVSLGIIGLLVHEVTQLGTIVSAGITTTVGVFCIRPLENYFRRATNHIFFKDSYDYAQALHALSSILYTSLNKEEIITRSQDILRGIFKTNDVDFLLGDTSTERTVSENQGAGFPTLSQPITFGQNTIGILRLGKKRSGDSYTKEDLQLVSTFVFQAAISLSKAELHQQVQEYSAHLEQLVDDRTKEIKKIQEGQRQNMIDISHNLQTPLAIIRGEVEFLAEGALGPEHLKIARKSLDRVSGFIRQLLHLARLEHSLYPVELIPIELGALLKDQSDYFEVIAEDKGAHIITQIASDITILGNKRLLEELFTNLVANALKYSKKDSQTLIEISLRVIGSEAYVVIQDNGIGIHPDDLPSIFNRFYRVTPASPSLSGTGLGLAIVQRIVDTHKGRIQVESTLGKGTTFTIVFPQFSELAYRSSSKADEA